MPGRLLREWQAEQSTKSNRAFREQLRARYDVRVEGPAASLFEPGAATPAPGTGTR